MRQWMTYLNPWIQQKAEGKWKNGHYQWEDKFKPKASVSLVSDNGWLTHFPVPFNQCIQLLLHHWHTREGSSSMGLHRHQDAIRRRTDIHLVLRESFKYHTNKRKKEELFAVCLCLGRCKVVHLVLQEFLKSGEGKEIKTNKSINLYLFLYGS